MNQPRPSEPARSDTAWGPSLTLLALAVGVLAGALFWWWDAAAPVDASAAAVASPPAIVGPPLAAVPPVAPAAASTVVSTAAEAAPAQRPNVPPPAIPRTREPGGDPTPDLSDYVNPGERPTMPQVIERLHQAGVRTGLGAFNPPGTRPPLVGLAVPENFALPEGYVRHHQATDDGQRIEAILMFAPDRQFFDAAGRPIAIPADRVVPPEMAPPGLPVRRITIPAPLEAPRPGS
ncbi:MAG TPA: hypothetical protein VHL79_21105 [Ramlibacter sp.]|jgi:hypothetical protein|nr:hypothetical protein [Ramlibacter sp.]